MNYKNLKYFKTKEFREIWIMSIAELYKNWESRDITCILLLCLTYLILEGEENQNSHLRYQNNGALLNISSESQLSFVFFLFSFAEVETIELEIADILIFYTQNASMHDICQAPKKVYWRKTLSA